MRPADGLSRAPTLSSRCVGQREIMNEGLCYVYEDGTYCRAIINGEPVNPSWGITKAGKPRKRLAQACLTCREKKINGIYQASVTNASGETSPSSSAPLFKNSPLEALSHTNASDRIRAPGELHEYSRKIENWNAGNPFISRKLRRGPLGNSRDMSVHSVESDWSGSGNDQPIEEFRGGSSQDQLVLQWEQDPYESDPRLTTHLLNLYFLHIGRTTYSMFPCRPFTTWVECNREKNQDHLMVLYAVLAMGSLFSNDPGQRMVGKRFAAVASYAAEKRFGKFTLQLCQSRLLLALYFSAHGKSQEAWDFCGSGLRAIGALKLNTEEGVKALSDGAPNLDFGFDRWTFEECCRRTFWSGLLMDRYNGPFGGTLFVINTEDAHVRLPCPEDMFEASSPCNAPFLDEDLFGDPVTVRPQLGLMAYLCLISALWGDVLTFTVRTARRPSSRYERHYEEFYSLMYGKFDAWYAMLPPNLQYSPSTLELSISEGYASIFVSLHALYNAAIITLNRHVRVDELAPERIRQNVERSFRHASDFLSMMLSLSPANRQPGLQFAFTAPFPGYVLMLSVDVLTSAGLFSTLQQVIDAVCSSMSCLDELANFWASARAQHKTVSTRLTQLTDMALQEQQGARNDSRGQVWRIDDSLETAFDNDDAVYRVESRTLFDVVIHLADCSS
ncbi:hypothetical protein ACEQ8H_005495 [Pleosporales sp. CAS-2024a]